MRTIFGSPVLWAGIVLFVIAAGIVLACTLYAASQGDINPNPVVAGMLAGGLFVLSLPLVLIGLGLGIAEHRGIYVRPWVLVAWVSLTVTALAIAKFLIRLI